MPEPRDATLVHGTVVAVGNRAALIRGPSGSGKSDLALRCLVTPPPQFALDIVSGAVRLVADDYVRLTEYDGIVIATAPETIAGRLEVRGVGIVTVPCANNIEIQLVVDLVDGSDVPRLPLPWPTTQIGTVTLPCLKLCAFEASAPLKLLLALAGPDDGGLSV